MDNEKKKRIAFSLYKSDYENLKKIAYVKRLTINSIVDDWLEKFIDENENDIEEYKQLQDKNGSSL